MFRQPLSLKARSLLAAGVALAAFLGLTGVALDAAIYETPARVARASAEQVGAYLATSEVSRSGRWLPPDVGPDSRFDQPNGNLYAGVLGPVENDDADADHWRSPSAQAGGFPFEKNLSHGEESFAGPLPTAHGEVYLLWVRGISGDRRIAASHSDVLCCGRCQLARRAALRFSPCLARSAFDPGVVAAHVALEFAAAATRGAGSHTCRAR